jgi:DNA-binding transcriptional LysR family regulator
VTPDHLRTFLTVRKHLNYTRAGEELFLSQPAVWRQVKQLEESLDVRLFERIGKSLHLTDAGRTLAEHAGRLLADHERAAEAVRSHRSAVAGSLRVGASTTPGLYLLPKVLGRFCRKYPEVEMHYTIENSLQIEQMIVRNELDLGFVGAHLASEELQLEPVLDDEIVCFASATHPLAKRRRIEARALEAETWVTREAGSGTRRLFETWLGSVGVKMRRTIELRGPEEVKVLVRAGVGISFMSLHGLTREKGRQRLARLAVAGLRLPRPVFLARHVDKHSSPVMEAFLSLVQARSHA